jgi:uncharacterized protein
MNYRGSILIIFFMMNVLAAYCQEHAIKVIARASSDSIVLRWAPLTPLAWQQLNKYGYRIERYTIVRDSSIVETKTLKAIGPQPVKPQVQASWERAMDNNDFVAIAAQAIFGESFEITKNTSNLVDIVNQSRELESRFSYALLAADISPIAADLSGLRYVDKDVALNEMYLYRVYSLVPEKILSIEMGFAYTGAREAIPLPVITEVHLRPEDHSVLLSWEVSQVKHSYSGYFIERSSDGGKGYTRLNNIPYVFVGEEEGVQNAYATFRDSLRSNADVFLYRIIGISPFGEEGPPTEPVAGKGLDKFDISIERLVGDVSTGGNIKLQWEFSEEQETLVRGFEVERSNNAHDGFTPVSPLLAPSERSYNDTSDEHVNYYRIALLSQDGRRRSSFPILIQKEDSIPPLSPRDLSAMVDSAGIVTLAWNQNTESDLLGYRVYRSNFRSSEFSQITVSPISSEQFRDTLLLRSLTRSRYYKIAAVDKRFNTSDFSPVAEIILPDIIRPVQVAFTAARATEGEIFLKWTKCSSEDAASYRVSRKALNESDWIVVKEMNHPDSTSFTDIPGTGFAYLYKVVAVDKSGLTSADSKVIQMTELKKTITAAFARVNGTVDRSLRHTKLSWAYPFEDDLKGFCVYRAAGEEPISLYKTIPADANFFVDGNMRMDTRYVYRLKAIYRDGRESPFSSLIEVKY